MNRYLELVRIVLAYLGRALPLPDWTSRVDVQAWDTRTQEPRVDAIVWVAALLKAPPGEPVPAEAEVEKAVEEEVVAWVAGLPPDKRVGIDIGLIVQIVLMILRFFGWLPFRVRGEA